MLNIPASIAPAVDLATLDAGASAYKVMAKFAASIYMGLALEG